MIDPLAEQDIDVQSFDIPRLVTVYPDRSGLRWWTKAWFNNREEGESSVEITRQLAILFLQNQIEKDQWLEEYFPKQMEAGYTRAPGRPGRVRLPSIPPADCHRGPAASRAWAG